MKGKIILITPLLNSFVKTDIDLLSDSFHVVINHYDWSKKILTPFYLLHQFFFILFRIKSTEKILIHFGGYWSLLPALIGKVFKTPTFIVLHGTDCASLPHVNYGSLRKKLLKLACRVSYKNAFKLLPVSSSLVRTENTYLGIIDEQGYRYHFPSVNTPYEVVYNGIDFEFWNPGEIDKEEGTFISVFSDEQFELKGGDLILSLAKENSQFKFYIAGMKSPSGRSQLPENLIFLGNSSKGSPIPNQSSCRQSCP